MLTMDVNRTYLVLNSCFQFPARRALQGDSVIAIFLFYEAYTTYEVKKSFRVCKACTHGQQQSVQDTYDSILI